MSRTEGLPAAVDQLQCEVRDLERRLMCVAISVVALLVLIYTRRPIVKVVGS